jgi:TonB family protein
MKKIILSLTALLSLFSLTAFAYLNWGNAASTQCATIAQATTAETSTSGFGLTNIIGKDAGFELLYKVDSRFITTVTKEQLRQAKSIIDILPAEATRDMVSYSSSGVSVLLKDMGTDHLEKGNNEILNEAQSKLLQSADYSNNIYIKADYKKMKIGSDQLEENYLTYYITVVPEQEASYRSGYDSLVSWLRINSALQTAIIEKNNLRPGMVNFTVTKEGTVENVHLTSSSGYPTVDEKLVEMLSNLPGQWNAATDANGEKVSQEFVFFFGMEGC